MKRLTNEELTQIRERAEKATEGPWKVEESRYEGQYNVASVNEDYDLSACLCPKKDAAFIAHAREDIPKLLAENERLQKKVHALTRVLYDHAREGCEIKLDGGDNE